MLGAEPADLLVAYPVIGRAKLERLMEVARHTRVTVALDSTVRRAPAFRRRARRAGATSACWRKWMWAWAALACRRARNWCNWRRASCGCRT